MTVKLRQRKNSRINHLRAGTRALPAFLTRAPRVTTCRHVIGLTVSLEITISDRLELQSTELFMVQLFMYNAIGCRRLLLLSRTANTLCRLHANSRVVQRS